jgi:YaiO family outer membrane protein
LKELSPLKQRFYIIITLKLLLTLNLFSQVNADSLFRIAIEQSRENDYEGALLNAKRVLSIHPSRCDVNVFIANVFAWQKNSDSSKHYINKAYNLNPRNSELYDAWLNVLLWNGEYDELLITTDIAVSNGYDNDYNILIKRLIAFKYLGEYSKASELFADSENKIFLDSVQIKNLYREILLQQKQNILTTYYSLDYLPENNPAAQHQAFIDYAFKIKQNSLLLRLNYANRYSKNDLQLESDYYHILNNSRYLYLNYGYSFNYDLFPKHRAGLEYFSPLRKGFEASLGGRYLYFPDSHIGIITGSVAKYINSIWISLRPYYTFTRPGNSVALIADVRIYGKLPLSYWNLELGYGNSPDERFILNQTGNYFQMDSYRFKLGKNLLIGKTDELKISAGYAYEEFVTDDYINRYIMQIIYRHRIK